jgi:glycine oxidase
VLAGSTEENAGFIKVNTDAAIAELTAFARRFVTALEKAPVESTWAGLRPGSADGFPTLGRHPDFGNLFLAGGHFRAGIQLSPATGRVMSELLRGRPTSVPLADFRLDRPHGIRQEARFHS